MANFYFFLCEHLIRIVVLSKRLPSCHSTDRLNQIKGIKVDVESVETNIVYFDILESTNVMAKQLCKMLEEHGILVIPESSSKPYRSFVRSLF
ncbi:hypothetical protein Dimus_007893 [Dionaea muscipula]